MNCYLDLISTITCFNGYSSRSSHQRCSVKKDVLRSFAKFTGKHLCETASAPPTHDII